MERDPSEPRVPQELRYDAIIGMIPFSFFHIRRDSKRERFFYLVLRGLQEMKALLVLMVDLAERYHVLL